jgi:hypothetical protein
MCPFEEWERAFALSTASATCLRVIVASALFIIAFTSFDVSRARFSFQ